MSKATPGPWFCGRDGYGNPIILSHDPDSDIIPARLARLIEPTPGRGTVDGNQKLMAASPELYFAAAALLEAWDNKPPLAWQPDGQFALLEKLRDAVAKAEGGQP